MLPARAIENLCYVAAVNRVGTDGKGLVYTGDSHILDFQGESLLLSMLAVLGAINSLQFTAMNTVTLIDLDDASASSGNAI